MKKIFTFILIMSLMTGCATVPLTGRRQLNIMGDAEIAQMSLTQYRSFLSENKVSSDAAATAMMNRVGNRIRLAVEKYFRENNMASEIEKYDWEFNLVDSDQLNAWCMPGGKVVVYTGILPTCKNEAGLAVVMGHEIAHAIARHGNERMSQGMIQQLGGVALSVAIANKPQETQALWMGAYGVGSQVGAMLPFSRGQESEADKIGLTFSAMAGYDPREAPLFWERMAAASGGEGPPEFLSTHPASSTRIKNLQDLIPSVLPLYQSASQR